MCDYSERIKETDLCGDEMAPSFHCGCRSKMFLNEIELPTHYTNVNFLA